jgi:hypothetical protein
MIDNLKKISYWLWKNRGQYIILAADWYVKNYHSNDYIHISLIKDEIKRRIERAEAVMKDTCEEESARKLKALEIQHSINEAGWCAEIECLEKKMVDVMKMRDEVINLRLETVRRIKELALINANNQHVGREVLSSVGASMGSLGKVALSISDLAKEVEDSEEKEAAILQIPSTLEPTKVDV